MGKRWSDTEDIILINLYPNYPRKHILEKLPERLWCSVLRRAHRLGIKRESWEVEGSKEKVEFDCEGCGKHVKRYPNPHNSNRFCSPKCYYGWKKEHPEKNYFHKYPRLGKLNGNWGRHPNHKERVDMKMIGMLGRKAQGLSKTTKPEARLYGILESKDIPFEPQGCIGYYCVDAFIPPDIVIEVDGEYWHNFPDGLDRDFIKTKALEDAGYKVHRYWAKDMLDHGEELLEWLIR